LPATGGSTKSGEWNKSNDPVINEFVNKADPSNAPDEGPLYDLSFARDAGQRGRLGVELGRGFSDAGELFGFNQGLDRDFSLTQDSIATPDFFESERLTVNYDWSSQVTSWSLRSFLAREQYQSVSRNNRERRGIQLSMRRSIGSVWDFYFSSRVTKRDFSELGRVDNDDLVSLEFSRGVGLQLQLGFRLDQSTRDTTDPFGGYDENRFSLTLRYRPLSGGATNVNRGFAY